MRSPGPLAALLLAACAAGGMAATTGTRAVPDPVAAVLKTTAVDGAREEIARSTDNAGMRYGIYLDTMVGPTPEAQLYEWAHPRAWLDAMVATRRVDGLFGVPGRNDRLPRTAFAIEVGEPFPGTGDTMQIVYDWCVRQFPAERGGASRIAAWRDLFVRGDTGWTRVGHRRAVAPTACSP